MQKNSFNSQQRIRNEVEEARRQREDFTRDCRQTGSGPNAQRRPEDADPDEGKLQVLFENAVVFDIFFYFSKAHGLRK